MKKHTFRLRLCFALFLFSCHSQVTIGQDAHREKVQSVLVTPDWLAKEKVKNKDLRILDLAFRKTNYQTGHIPGALFVDWRTDIIDDEDVNLYQLPKRKSMEKLLSRLGVGNQSLVVLTDNMGNRSSVRMYYTLKYFGHERIKILDGGTNRWSDTGRKLTTEVEQPTAVDYSISGTEEDFFVKLEAVQNAIDNDVKLIDGRPEEQFSGEKPGKAFHTNRPHERLGHVPTAVNIPWKANLNPDGTFKSLEELRKLYSSSGIDVNDPAIAYCNEGLHAAMPWFIFRELFGNEDIRIYDDSMAEWANRKDTALEVVPSKSEKQKDQD
ncbi:MAG: sulfurtransferase [Planctomycetota bacterium]